MNSSDSQIYPLAELIWSLGKVRSGYHHSVNVVNRLPEEEEEIKERGGGGAEQEGLGSSG